MFTDHHQWFHSSSSSMCRAELEQLLVVAAQAITAGEGGARGGDDIKVRGEREGVGR